MSVCGGRCRRGVGPGRGQVVEPATTSAVLTMQRLYGRGGGRWGKRLEGEGGKRRGERGGRGKAWECK